MAGEKILIVDDEAVVKEVISHYLLKEGFSVITAESGFSALKVIRQEKPDLILLDILLPELDGMEICRELRRETEVPVIFITSRSEILDIALGLGIGGDDYIIKPFNPIEVVARVKAHLRRSRQLSLCQAVGEHNKILEFPGLMINLSTRAVKVNGAFVTLTAREFDILALLAEKPNHFFKSDQLMRHIWNSNESVDHRSLMVHISKLRKKIEQNPASPEYIITVRGIGYKFSSPD